MEGFDYTPVQPPVPKKKKRIGLWIALILVAVLTAGFFLLRAPVRQLVNCSRYTVAELQMYTGEYDRAIEEFSALGDFQDSAVRIQECFYYKGMMALADADYETAADCFYQAGDYEDAREYTKQTLYEWGHSLWGLQKYAEAEEVFSRLHGDYPDYGVPHFQTLEEAWAYCAQQSEQLALQALCYVAQMPEQYRDTDLLWNVLSNKVTYHVFAVDYDWDSGLLSVQVTAYYPSDRMLYAHRTGDDTVLQAGEREVLDQALALVEQAKNQTDSDLALELWLHDWLCEQITYSNPDMDIPTPQYLQLRELTCVGALEDGVANCQGYADAFYLLTNLAGLQVRKLSGVAEESHIWNVIWLDGAWYTVDVTFDDLSDMDEQARTYMWFNSAWDAAERTIHGGAEVLPGLAQTTCWDVTYYGMMDTVYTSLDDATADMLRHYAQNGSGWTYAVVDGLDADTDDFYEAVDRNMTDAGVWSASWTSVIEHAQGSTYLSIYWK